MTQPTPVHRVKWRPNKPVLLIAILLALVTIAGVGVYLVFFRGGTLTFFTISQAELGNWDDKPQSPALLIVATPSEVAEVAVTLQTSRDPKIIEQLRNVDYNRNFVVLVFYGLARSAGIVSLFNRFKGKMRL